MALFLKGDLAVASIFQEKKHRWLWARAVQRWGQSPSTWLVSPEAQDAGARGAVTIPVVCSGAPTSPQPQVEAWEWAPGLVEPAVPVGQGEGRVGSG